MLNDVKGMSLLFNLIHKILAMKLALARDISLIIIIYIIECYQTQYRICDQCSYWWLKLLKIVFIDWNKNIKDEAF